MRLFNKVAIVGTGLIGGSIGLAIKKHCLADEVVGISRHKQNLRRAEEIGAIDKGLLTIKDMGDADLVVLAAPISIIIKLGETIAQVVKKDCLVTDVGSTKQEIVSKLTRLFPKYVGSHPLAGSEKRGIIHARPGLFQDSLCILTPLSNSYPAAVRKIERLWRILGAKVTFLSPERHDKILSFVSHLPHAMAFALMNAVPQEYLKFASTGLKDATRIAASDSALWADIFLSNQKEMLKSLDSLSVYLAAVKSAIKNNDRAALMKILNLARKKRDRLPQ